MPPSLNRVGHLHPGNLLHRIDYLEYRETCFGTQIERFVRTVSFQVLQRLEVRIAQIQDMDIIANAGSVACFIIIPEHSQRV